MYDPDTYGTFTMAGEPVCWWCGEAPPAIDGRWCCPRCRRSGERMLRDSPTPAEIRAACERIQATWSPAQRLERAGFRCDDAWRRTAGRSWTAPVVHFDEDDRPNAGDSDGECLLCPEAKEGDAMTTNVPEWLGQTDEAGFLERTAAWAGNKRPLVEGRQKRGLDEFITMIRISPRSRIESLVEEVKAATPGGLADLVQAIKKADPKELAELIQAILSRVESWS